MARAGRYNEGRLYLAGASLALLLTAWAALAASDRQQSTNGIVQGVGQGRTQFAPRNSGQFAVVPQTRTRGS